MKTLGFVAASLVVLVIGSGPADAYELHTSRYSVTIDSTLIGTDVMHYDAHVLDLQTKQIVASPQLSARVLEPADSHTMVNGIDLHLHIVATPVISALFEVLDGGIVVESARAELGSALIDADGWHKDVARIDNRFKPPVLTHRVEPVYPAAALSSRTTGVVIVQVLIDKSGAVADTQVLKDGPKCHPERSRGIGVGWAARN
jgi:hypothetical protein